MNDKINFEIVKEDFYNAINPNIITENNGVVSFNTYQDANDNAYPAQLIDLYLNASSIHANFINLKRRLTYASGLLPKEEDNEALIEFINKPNMHGEDINDVFLKTCLDYSLQEMGAFQVIYNAGGKIAQIVHTDISKIRAEEPNEYGVVEAYWYSNDWADINNKISMNDGRLKNHKGVRIPVYDPEKGKEDRRQIFVMKRYTTGNPIYAIPSYNAALPAIELDRLLTEYNLNSVKGGFLPSAIISLIGNPSEENKKKFINDFNRTQTGVKNVKALFMWIDSMDEKPTFEKMSPDQNPDVFKVLKEQLVQDIATAHGASLELAGIQTGGADLGGDANKLNIARLAFIENVIKDFQRVLVKGFNTIFRYNELGEAVVVNEPLRITQPAAESGDLTRSERREMIFDLPPHPDDVIDNPEETINE